MTSKLASVLYNSDLNLHFDYGLEDETTVPEGWFEGDVDYDIDNISEMAEKDTLDSSVNAEEEDYEMGDELPSTTWDLQQVFRNLAGKDHIHKVEATLDFITLAGLDLPCFLDAVCWGDQDCISSPKVCRHWADFTASIYLPGIIKRLHTPPS